jgi:hypothetical protein
MQSEHKRTLYLKIMQKTNVAHLELHIHISWKKNY